MTSSFLDAELGSAVHAARHLALFVILFEEKGTFYKERGPKEDPFGPKGPLRGPWSSKGDTFGHTGIEKHLATRGRCCSRYVSYHIKPYRYRSQVTFQDVAVSRF